MSAGQQAVQSTHAAIQFCMDYPELSKEWHSLSRYLALVSVLNEHELEKLAEKCKGRGLLISIMREPDLEDQITAIAIEPSSNGRKVVSNFPLTLNSKYND